MPTYSQVSLQRGQGKTFAEIGDMFGVTRQRAHAIFTGYMKAYQHGENWLMYRRHLSHTHARKPCRICK